MATYRELLVQKKALDEQIQAAQRGERDGALATIRSLMEEFDITTVDIDGGQRRPRKTGKTGVPIKPVYRDPDSGRTWTGRGREPNWIAGKDRQAFRITD